MQRLRIALFAVATFFRVLFRRLFRGPKHPDWSLRFEVVAEVTRGIFMAGGPPRPEDGGRDPMRTVAAPINPVLASKCRLLRGELAGMVTDVHVPRALQQSADGAEGPMPTLLYYHGGGYVTCSPRTHRPLLARLAVEGGVRCIAPDYPKAPEQPFPAAIDACVDAYHALREQGLRPDQIALGGDSAGGGLTLAVLQRLRDAGEPLPACALLLSPWVDMEGTGESVRDNARFDYLRGEHLPDVARAYLGEHDPRDPLASAVYADLSGLPPMLMQTGSAELFCSEDVRLAERARDAGVDLTHEVEPGMVHVFQLFADFDPRARAAIARLGAFLRAHLSAAAR
ncbi:MAG: alpha/beta hydrolase [Myxococcales bacterium]|jgi:acetyl esterase/lipase